MANKPPRYRKLYDKISISADNTYKLDIMGGDDTLFMACYQIHMATRKGKRKKK